MIYLTSNPDKMHEAKEFFEKKHGLKVEILNPDFEPVEIQARTYAEVVAYTVKDAAERLGKAVVKSDAGFMQMHLADCLVHIVNISTSKLAQRNFQIC